MFDDSFRSFRSFCKSFRVVYWSRLIEIWFYSLWRKRVWAWNKTDIEFLLPEFILKVFYYDVSMIYNNILLETKVIYLRNLWWLLNVNNLLMKQSYKLSIQRKRYICRLFIIVRFSNRFCTDLSSSNFNRGRRRCVTGNCRWCILLKFDYWLMNFWVNKEQCSLKGNFYSFLFNDRI